MNRFERRKAESIKRRLQALKPAQRELAIQTGMELHDAIDEEQTEKRKQLIRTEMEKVWISKYDELYKQISQNQASRYAEKLADANSKASAYFKNVIMYRRAYLLTYLAWFAIGGSPEPQGDLTSSEVIEAATLDFKDRLSIIETRVGKEAGHFVRPELLYGALRWLATTYHGAKNGVKCSDLVDSCRRSCGFRYAQHQSEVTMGQYAPDYEITWADKKVKLREHLAFGTSKDPRYTIRIAFFFDDKRKKVIVGYIGLHQKTRVT